MMFLPQYPNIGNGRIPGCSSILSVDSILVSKAGDMRTLLVGVLSYFYTMNWVQTVFVLLYRSQDEPYYMAPNG